MRSWWTRHLWHHWMYMRSSLTLLCTTLPVISAENFCDPASTPKSFRWPRDHTVTPLTFINMGHIGMTTPWWWTEVAPQRGGGEHIFGSCDISLKNTPTSHAVRLCLCAHAVILWFAFCHALAYAITANCACLHLLGPSSCSENSIAIWCTGIHAYIRLYITSY